MKDTDIIFLLSHNDPSRERL